MADRDEDLDALSEEGIFDEARERLKICTEAEAGERTAAEYDLKFREGDQWDHDVITTASEAEPELTVNLTDMMVRRVVNNMKEQRPRGKVHPVSDGADEEVAKVINGLGRHIEYRSDAGVAYDIGADMAVSAGVGYWRLLTEYATPESFEQEICIRPIRNIFTVYMDPSSILPAGQDQRWCLISVKMRRDEFKRLYPSAKLADFSAETIGDRLTREWESKLDIRLAEYFRVFERKTKLLLIRNKLSGDTYTRLKEDVPAPETLEAIGDEVIRERETLQKEVQWFRLNGTRVVDRRVLPGQYIPVIRCEGIAVDIDGKVRRRGMVRSMEDAQRMVNYGEVAKIKRLALTPKAPWIVAEGQTEDHPEWNDANQKAYSKLTYKPSVIETGAIPLMIPPPQRTPPAQVEAGFTEMVQGWKTNLVALGGMPNEPQQSENEAISGIALARRDKLSDKSHFQYYDNQVLAIAHTWRIMLEWIPHYYSEQRMQRIIGEDGVPQQVMINQQTTEGEGDSAITKIKNDLTVGRYDVVMDTGPGYETKREEGAVTLLNLLRVPALAQLVVADGADLVFRSLDHPYMQELADRISAATPEGLKKILPELPERAQALVRALAQKLGEAEQKLQQLGLEQKYKMGIEQLRAATKIHETETRAATAKDVEDIRAGAAMIERRFQHAGESAEGRGLINTGEQSNGGSNASAQQ